MIKKYLKYYLKKFLKKDSSRWLIGIVYGSLSNFNIKKTIFFKPPSLEFWADPFLFENKKKKYIFFENFKKKENKGVISVGEIKNNKLVNINDILVKDHHLSYPFVFKRGNSIFMIPETHQTKQIEIYISKKFPLKWKLYSTTLEGEIVADPTIFFHKKKTWLFVNKTKKNLKELNKNLYIYQVKDLKFKKLIPHKKNPVISSLFGGRNAGNIFFENGKIYRPAQINKENIYGYGLCISEIKNLSLKNYNEKIIKVIKPNIFKNQSGIHHISKFKNISALDFNFLN